MTNTTTETREERVARVIAEEAKRSSQLYAVAIALLPFGLAILLVFKTIEQPAMLATHLIILAMAIAAAVGCYRMGEKGGDDV